MISFACEVILVVLVATTIAYNPCNLRVTDSGGICVCNSSYCDTVPALENLTSGQYQLYTSSKANPGFSSVTGNFTNSSSDADATVTITNLTRTYQTIYGFGGAFTDSAGINIQNLTNSTQELLIQSYFGTDGIQYSMCRVPIGGTDFSTRGYSYCDDEDTLDSFALTDEDYNYKIPYIQRAIELRGSDNLKLFATAWSAPTWMKTNALFNGMGRVRKEYYDLWAKYYIKFFDAYLENNITFWGVTTQNEPIDGLIGVSVSNNGFTDDEMVEWISNALGPAIRNSTYSDLKIMGHDDQRLYLPTFKYQVLIESEALNYLDGIAIHWYYDYYTPGDMLDYAFSDEKDLFRLGTEASITPAIGNGVTVVLGSWSQGESYMNSIIQDMEYDFTGWVDWNLVLDDTGKPTWVDSDVDAAVLVNATADEFYKQPMFYAIGHFSKFVVPNSVRVHSDSTGKDFQAVAFVRPDGNIAVVLYNNADAEKTVELNITGSTEVVTIPANSFNTLLYAL